MAYSPVNNQTFYASNNSTEHNDNETSYASGIGRESSASISINELNSSSKPHAHHQRGWSDATAFSPEHHEENLTSLPKMHEKGPSACSTSSAHSAIVKDGGSSSETWTLELVAILLGLGAVGSIIGVLAYFNGHSLPKWPYYITLNALIALLATVANAAMGFGIQSAISQFKWIRFRESRAPLADMEIFDEASRGAWGSFKLLVSARGGLFGSFGAVTAIAALALGPFAQQIATYRAQTVESTVGATIPRALNYTGALTGNSSATGFVPILPMKAAVYNGLFAENGRPAASLPFHCESGNCTWREFETLAVCHACVDITPFITRYCANGSESDSPNMSECGWQVPQGARLDSSSEVFSMTSFIPSAYGDVSHSTIMRLIFMGTENQDGLMGDLNPWALQCSLEACVQRIASTVNGGTLTETITETITNHSVVDMSSASPESDLGVYFSSKDTGSPPYVLGMGALLSMRGWFATTFANGSAVRSAAAFNRTVSDVHSSVVVNLTVGISSGETFFDSDVVTAFYWNHYEYPDGLDMLMRDLASSMTTAFRSFSGAVPLAGIALRMESFVHVRWGFAVLPAVVAMLASLFLAIAMWRARRSRTELWKSSALAMLFVCLDAESRARFEGVTTLGERRRRAKELRVRLSGSEDSEVLLQP